MDDIKAKITPELALAAARILHDYCDSIETCSDCPLEPKISCGREPYYWSIPERKKDADF